MNDNIDVTKINITLQEIIKIKSNNSRQHNIIQYSKQH